MADYGDQPPPDEFEPAREIILGAADCPGFDHVYCVGPFASRVSFAFQQRRALELVWALHTSRRSDALRNIAVVGASLAGLMVTAALKAYDYNVDLFEQNVEPLKNFERSNHRYVHPTMGIWPKSSMSGTTRLPFMNWHEDACASVAQTVKIWWKNHHSQEKRLARMLYTRRRIKKIEKLRHVCREGRERERYQLEAEVQPYPVVKTNIDPDVPEQPKVIESHPKPSDDRVDQLFGGRFDAYDAVILATGFGAELSHNLSSAGSYWEPDHIGHFRDDPEVQTLVISGTGDGGLADLIRFMVKEDPQFGLDPCFEDITRNKALMAAIDEIETPILDDLACIARVHDKETRHRKTKERIDQASLELKEFYEDKALRLLDRDFGRMLESHLVPENRIQLVGLNPAPYVPGVSPVLKCLLGAITALTDSPDLLKSHIQYYRNEDHDRKAQIKPCASGGQILVITQNGMPIDVRGDHVICRHGASISFADLLDEDVIAQIQANQRWYSNFSWPQLDSELKGFATNLYKVYEPDFSEEMTETHFAQIHQELAEAYFEKLVGGLDLRTALDPDTAQPIFYYSPTKKTSRNRPIPTEVFGIRVEKCRGDVPGQLNLGACGHSQTRAYAR